MSDIDRVIRSARWFETMLERHFDARGRGLHGKLDSMGKRLPGPLVRQLRYIATVRNRIVHEAGARLEDRRNFHRTCRQARRQLRWLRWGKIGRRVRRVAVGLALAGGIVAAWLVMRQLGLPDWLVGGR